MVGYNIPSVDMLLIVCCGRNDGVECSEVYLCALLPLPGNAAVGCAVPTLRHIALIVCNYFCVMMFSHIWLEEQVVLSLKQGM